MWIAAFAGAFGRLSAPVRSVVAVLLVLAVADGAAAATFVPARGSPIELEVNTGGLVRLDRPAATVFIANPDIGDVQVKSPSLVYLMGKKPGETTLYAVDADERVLAGIPVTVVHSLGRLQQAVQAAHPDVRVELQSVGDAIVVDGSVPTAAVAENVRRLAARFVDKDGEIINRLSVTSPTQVNLRVRVAEISRTIEKQLGFNWDAAGSIGSFAFGLGTFNPFNTNVVTDALAASVQSGRWDVNVLIDALEDEGLVSILAEPNLTAMSGETASFLAGGEFPILVPQGTNRITIEFKKFGVSLAFTPTIVDEGRISLRVQPEVSELSNNGAVSIPIAGGALTVPALTVRRAETTVELGSGQSFAIAGLLRNNVADAVHKFPGLGDLPIIGALFRSDRFQRNESELVIIVTPYLVRPAPTASLAAPNDGYSPPSDAERLLVGGTHRRNAETGPVSAVTPGGARLIGPVGFILD